MVASAGGALEKNLIDRGGSLIRLPMQARDPLSIAINAAKLRRLIRAERVDLVHVRSRAPAFSAWAAARTEATPMVTTYHGIYRARSPMKRWYNSIMTKGDLVLAGSRFAADHIASEHRLRADKIVVTPEGVDTDRFDPARVGQARVAAARRTWGLAPGDSRQVILLAARMTRLKGHALAIEALAALGREDVVLVLAGPRGKAGYEREIRAAAQRAGLAGVKIPGPIDDMPGAYLAADFVVAPSIVAESFGRTVAEAGAMERPVLAADLGGPAEIIDHQATGWLVGPSDTLAWTAALERALRTGPDARRQMGAAARERMKRFYSVGRMCESTFDAYARVLRRRA